VEENDFADGNRELGNGGIHTAGIFRDLGPHVRRWILALNMIRVRLRRPPSGTVIQEDVIGNRHDPRPPVTENWAMI
jgi:hypothetical protein